MTPRTRQTSVDAYNTLRDSGALSRMRWMVYDIVFQFGPLTQRELYERSRTWPGFSGAVGSATRRLLELRDRGLVEVVGERLCRYTQVNCEEWDVTALSNPLPVPDRPETEIEAIRRLLRERRETDIDLGRAPLTEATDLETLRRVLGVQDG